MCMQIKNGNKFGEGSHRMIINKKRFSKIRKGSHRFLQMIIDKKKDSYRWSWIRRDSHLKLCACR